MKKGEIKMSSFAGIKPIQATPELKGSDAIKFVKQACSKPDKKEIEKNKVLLGILKRIQK